MVVAIIVPNSSGLSPGAKGRGWLTGKGAGAAAAGGGMVGTVGTDMLAIIFGAIMLNSDRAPPNGRVCAVAVATGLDIEVLPSKTQNAEAS